MKDFYRNKENSFPYVIIVSLIIALAEFLILFASSIGLNQLITYNFQNEFYFSGGLSYLYSNFTILIISLIIILAFIMILVVSSSLILSKKRDIAIMKSLGTIPRRLYSFYLTEVYIVFIIGFFIGLIVGLVAFGIFSLFMSSLGLSGFFYFDFFFTPILFLSSILGIFFVPGTIIRKLANRSAVKIFSKDIPFDLDASKSISFIPKWISAIGFNFKISVLNTLRRRGEYKRFLIVFSIISVIIFTLGLGTFVLSQSAQNWIHKAQGNNLIVIGHENLIEQYALMYEMFSDPSIIVDTDAFNFLDSQYLFNFSDIEEFALIPEISKIDERLLTFSDASELNGIIYLEDGGYQIVGQERSGIFPILGVNTSNLIQNFELEGSYFTPSDSFMYMLIGDGLSYNFFDSPFDQSMRIEDLQHTFHVSGIVIDTFYSGHAGYIDSEIMREELNFTNHEINLVVLQLQSGINDDEIEEQLNLIISGNLGENFTQLSLTSTFQKNQDFINSLGLFPNIIIFVLSVISLFSLYNYQKSGLIDKAKDFLIMRAIGSSYKSIKRILFLETFYAIIPSLFFSLGIGMILNSLVLFDRVTLPPLSVPFILFGILISLFLLFNYLSLSSLMKKIKKFSIKDFEIY
ncbi:MAG: FtsX-like permease family protein [Promethearchaeota archaeon]